MMNWLKMTGNNARERRSGSGISSNNENGGGGCGWGSIHIIKHHHWPHFMRRLTHHKGKRLIGCRTTATSRDKMQEQHKLLVGEQTTEPLKNNSIRARMKALLAEEIDKLKGRHRRSLTYQVQSDLKPTDSTRRLEDTDLNPLAETLLLDHQSPRSSYKEDEIHAAPNNKISREEPIISHEISADFSEHEHIDQKKSSENSTSFQGNLESNNELMNLKPIRQKTNSADSMLSHQKEYLDALNIISANEELLVKVLQDPGSPLAHHFRNQQALNTKRGMAKSETFPPPGTSGKRGLKPSRFKQMHGDESGVERMHEVSDNPFQDSLKHRRNHGETRVVIKRFKDLKQKIKHVIKESRKEMHRVAMDAVVHKIPRGHKIEMDKSQFKNFESYECQGKESPGSGYESDCSVPSFNKNKLRLRQMRRAFSLTESLDRYCQLYETSFNRENKHQTSSEEVRRMNVVPKHLARIYSLPDMKLYLNLNEESSGAFSPGMAIQSDTNRVVRKGRSFDEKTKEDFPIFSEDQLQIGTPMERIFDQDQAQLNAINSATENEVEVTLTENNETKILSTDYPMESINEEHPIELSAISSAAENEVTLTLTENREEKIQLCSRMHDSEDSEIEPAQFLDGLANNNLVKHEEFHKTENVDKIPDKHLMHDIYISNLQVNAEDKAEFSYVKDILELSGFSGDGLLGTWHSDDQPVNPLVYEEAEGCLVFDPDCCGNESGGKCDHPLLFDLINEVLMEIYARSYSYYPFPLSHLSHISPMPTGQHVLREVWGLISGYLSLRPEVDHSLDHVVGSDLARSGWWMNLQFDCECVGLELEDLIFNDLFEELIWA